MAGSHFNRDMHEADWDQLFQRQRGSADRVNEWLEALELRPGDCVLDAGCGSGFVSLEAAKRVAPLGLVHAVDRSADALAYLAGVQETEQIPNVHRHNGDVATCDLSFGRIDAALITMMLHHNEDALTVLRNVGSVLSRGARIVIAELDADGPGESGLPLSFG